MRFQDQELTHNQISYTESSYKAKMSALYLGRDLPPCFLTGRLLFECLYDRTPMLRRRYIIQPYSILNGRLVGSRAAWHHSRASKGLLSRVTDEKDSRARYCLQTSTVNINCYRKCMVHYPHRTSRRAHTLTKNAAA